MAGVAGTAAHSLPRFLLPRLSWTGPPGGTPSALRAAASISTSFASTSQPAPRCPRTAAFHTARQSRQCVAPPKTRNGGLSITQRHPSLRRSFHATAPRSRDHHFDTLKFIQRLQGEGFTEDQAVAMMKVLNDVIEER